MARESICYPPSLGRRELRTGFSGGGCFASNSGPCRLFRTIGDPLSNSPQKENSYQYGVLQRFVYVGFHQPKIMDHAQDRGNVDQAMQKLPALPTETRIQPAVEVTARGMSNMNPAKPTVMNRRFCTSFHISGQLKNLSKPIQVEK